MASYTGGQFAGGVFRNAVAANSGPPVGFYKGVPLIRSADIYFGGGDYVAGVVEINGVPRLAKVALHAQESGLMVKGGWTDAAGAFRFEGLSPTLKFYIVAFDPLTGEQAVVFDRI